VVKWIILQTILPVFEGFTFVIQGCVFFRGNWL